MSDFFVRAEYAAAIKWNARGSCGNAGCKDPECCCSFCGLPLGKTDEELEKERHDPECYGCPLCVDHVPIILWRHAGAATEQAQFHDLCFQKIIHVRTHV